MVDGGIIAGALGGSAISAAGGLTAMGASKKQASRQRKFMAWYDSTKYQRAMGDLKAANLNPILAAGGGVRGGSGGSPGIPSFQNPMGDVSATPERILGMRQAKSMIDLNAENTENVRHRSNNIQMSNRIKAVLTNYLTSPDGQRLLRNEQRLKAWMPFLKSMVMPLTKGQ